MPALGAPCGLKEVSTLATLHTVHLLLFAVRDHSMTGSVQRGCWCAAATLVVVWFSSSTAAASCGNYLHTRAGSPSAASPAAGSLSASSSSTADFAESADGNSPRPAQDRSAPARRCTGPRCSNQLPVSHLPTTPAVSERTDEVAFTPIRDPVTRDGAFRYFGSDSNGPDRGHPRRVKRPPRV